MAAILWYMSIIALQSVSIVPCPLWRIVLDTTLCDKVLQLLAAGRWWFLTNIPVGLINTTNRHDIIEINISLKALNTFDLDRLLLYHVMNGVDLYGKWDKLLDIYCHCIYRFQRTVKLHSSLRSRGGRGGMVVGFTTTYAISANHHQRCEL